MRVFGGLGTTAASSLEDRVRSIEDPDGRLVRIGAGGAWALVRIGLADLDFVWEPDGSFIIVDGELFAIDGRRPRHVHASGHHPLRAFLTRFRAEGPACLAGVNGSATIFIWDAAVRRLTLARDRWGFGSCFWMESDGGVLFASDIRSLIRGDRRSQLDEAAIDLFLAGGFISAPWTSLAHIRKVPAAHCLVAEREGTRLSRYWRASGQPKIRLRLEERKELLEQALTQAIERQLPGDRTPAVLLSGGIDSMYLTALLARTFGVPLPAFTYRYADYHGKFNESDRAQATARLLGIEHHEMTVGPRDIADSVERILIEHSGPLSYGAHSAILKDVSRTGVQILYNGQGNGALYPSPTERLGQRLGGVPGGAAVASSIERMLGRRLPLSSAARYAARVGATGLNWRFHAPLTPDAIRRSLYVDPSRLDHARRASQRLFAAVVAEFAGEDGVERLAGPLHRLYSADGTLTWSSSFGRAHGLRSRSPYYDNDYVDLLYRMRRSGGKREIRELAAKLLPRDLAFAPKVAQTLPISDWLRGPLSDFLAERLSARRLLANGVFRHEAVSALRQRHRDGAGSHGWTLWNLLMITEWQEIVEREAGLYFTEAAHRRANPTPRLVRAV